jgi:hypothetical protein
MSSIAPWQNWLDKHPQINRKTIYFFADLIQRCDAMIYARLSYGAPFLYRYGPIGYFGYEKKLGIYFGFYWGKLLTEQDVSGIFHPDERKMVKLVLLEGRADDDEFTGALLALVDSALKIDDLKYRSHS